MFTNQIVIGNRASKFLQAGRLRFASGGGCALNPRAVGLLYAGSSSVAIANPINEVLIISGVTMVELQELRARRFLSLSSKMQEGTGQHAARLERIPRGWGMESASVAWPGRDQSLCRGGHP